MQLRTLLFLSFLSFAFSATAQDYTGVWEGHFYLVNKKRKMNVRIEVMQQEKELVGVISTRGFENNTAYGCDYIVAGQIVKNKLVLYRTSVQRGIAMHDCASFSIIELTLDKTDTSTAAKAQWFWTNDSKEAFGLKKTATEMSEIGKEEIADEERKRISRKENREKFKQIHWSETTTIDELQVNSKAIVITVSSVEKDPKATLSAFVNGKMVALNSNLAKNVLVIRIEDVALHNRVVFLNNSATGEQLDIKITFQQGKKTKEWITSIEALDNSLLLLTHKNEDSNMYQFPAYGEGPW